MKKILTIAFKELNTYFRTPTAYIVLIISISIFNIFFFLIINANSEASLRDIFKVMEFMFVFIVPLLTMKLFSEEKFAGTMEFLMTTPVSNTAIVLGKYLACLIFFTILILITSSYYFILEIFSAPDRMPILCGYLGIFLEGALFIAIGLLMSSLTKNQIIAAISSYVILFFMYFSITINQYLSGSLKAIVRYSGAWSHTENFAVGLITSSDLVYFVSGTILCLILTRISIENKL